MIQMNQLTMKNVMIFGNHYLTLHQTMIVNIEIIIKYIASYAQFCATYTPVAT